MRGVLSLLYSFLSGQLTSLGPASPPRPINSSRHINSPRTINSSPSRPTPLDPTSQPVLLSPISQPTHSSPPQPISTSTFPLALGPPTAGSTPQGSPNPPPLGPPTPSADQTQPHAAFPHVGPHPTSPLSPTRAAIGEFMQALLSSPSALPSPNLLPSLNLFPSSVQVHDDPVAPQPLMELASDLNTPLAMLFPGRSTGSRRKASKPLPPKPLSLSAAKAALLRAGVPITQDILLSLSKALDFDNEEASSHVVLGLPSTQPVA